MKPQGVSRALILGLVALALVLLAGAGLMVRSYRNLMAVRPGFNAADVTTLEIALPAGRYDSYERISAFYSELSARAAALPGVQAVGFGQSIPMAGEEGCTATMR